MELKKNARLKIEIAELWEVEICEQNSDNWEWTGKTGWEIREMSESNYEESKNPKRLSSER